MPDGGFSTNFRLNGDFNIFNLTLLSLKHKSSIAFFFISGGAEAGAKIPEHWWCDLKKKLATLPFSLKSVASQNSHVTKKELVDVKRTLEV